MIPETELNKLQKSENGDFDYYLKLAFKWLLTSLEVHNCMIYILKEISIYDLKHLSLGVTMILLLVCSYVAEPIHIRVAIDIDGGR